MGHVVGWSHGRQVHGGGCGWEQVPCVERRGHGGERL